MMTQQPKYYRDLLDRLLEQDNTDSHEQRLQVLRDKFGYRGPAHFDQEDQLVVTDGFNCRSKQLTSLAGAPVKVGGKFNCSNNQLTSLEGAPVKVGGDFDCYDNQLTSLAGAPKKVGGDFYCDDNQLTSLVGAPMEVGGDFSCCNNWLTSLVGSPTAVGGDFYCFNNQLTSLEGIPRSISGYFAITVNATTPLLKILTVEGITEFYFYKPNTHNRIPELESLFKEFYGQGARGRLLCGIEMLQMGYRRNARL
jgi:hypothetical protein